MRFYPALLILVVFLLSTKAAAEMDAYASMSYGLTGENLAEKTGGQNYIIRSGSGLSLSLGLIFPVTPTKPHRFEGQIAAGLILDSDKNTEDNGVQWIRYPIDALYYYRSTEERFRFGWGLTYHLGNKLTGKGINSSASTSMNNSLGWVVAFDKLWNANNVALPSWGLGIRYTSIKYHMNTFNKDVNASSLAMTLSFFSY